MALHKVVGPLCVVIQIPCGPELRGEDLARAVSMRSWPTATGGAAVKPGCSVSASPLFVFADLHQLSDRAMFLGR